jgi:CRISPR-associated protein Cas5d
MKSERVSYDVPTPSAIRGILEAVHWKPAIVWRVHRVHVMRPVRFENLRRNELGGKIALPSVKTAMKKGRGEIQTFIEDDRQQRAAMLLKDVEYLVEASFELSGLAGPDDNEGKHLDIFNRRLDRGQVYQRPCLGCREFPAFVERAGEIGPSQLADLPEGNRDLGWMLYDLDYENGCQPMFFKARLDKGIVTVPPHDSAEVKR